jgi:signal transduction histidine kinase/ActR/RegA family two-component response regulator
MNDDKNNLLKLYTRIKTLSTTTKIMLVVLVIILFNTIIIATSGFVLHRNEVIRNYSNRSMAIAKTAALAINANEFWYALETNEKNEHYLRLQSHFERIKEEETLLYFYGGTFDPDFGMIMYIEGHGNIFGLNGHVPLSIFPQAAFDTYAYGTAFVTEVYRLNIDGSLGISAYAPIFDEDENTIGIIGVLISLSVPIARSSSYAWMMLMISLAVFLVLIWVPMYFIRRLEARQNRTARQNEKLYNEIVDKTIRLEAADRAKSEFLRNINHEIRTPLNAITGMTSIGKSASDMERRSYCFDRIEEASGLLLGIINSILDMSKIESGTFALTQTTFDFEKALNKAVNILCLKIKKKRIDFHMTVDANIPAILVGDEQRLIQVITNLLNNAVKFTPEEGSVRIDTCFVGEEDGLCTVQISVADSGIGISEEQHSHIFQPFWQSESNLTRRFEGTGLGLAISKNIIEMMGGKIWVVSKVGKGTTLTFTVLLKRGDAEDTHDMETTPVLQFPGRRILLVEDVEINREIVMAFLQPAKLEIDCAENGKEAFDMFSQDPERYDMIFMDLHMPQMNGYEATRCIRALDFDKAKTIPIVAMTANTFKEDVEKCLNAGMNGHIGKPLEPDEVLEQIAVFLG